MLAAGNVLAGREKAQGHCGLRVTWYRYLVLGRCPARWIYALMEFPDVREDQPFGDLHDELCRQRALLSGALWDEGCKHAASRSCGAGRRWSGRPKQYTASRWPAQRAGSLWIGG